ncbi:MAG: tetratricopeptide repeat protein [Rhodospirillaceae bacterium]
MPNRCAPFGSNFPKRNARRFATGAARLFAVAAEHQCAGRLDDAILDYTLALSLYPNMGEAYNNLSDRLRGTGRPDAAVACYRRAIALRPRNS